MAIDLRSDTVTRPSPGMRDAIAQASVGDDVYGDDPTVNSLEERVASMFGKEAGLFTPTGSLANQLAIRMLVAPAMPAIPPANRKKSRLVFLGSSKSMQQLQENGDSFK